MTCINSSWSLSIFGWQYFSKCFHLACIVYHDDRHNFGFVCFGADDWKDDDVCFDFGGSSNTLQARCFHTEQGHIQAIEASHRQWQQLSRFRHIGWAAPQKSFAIRRITFIDFPNDRGYYSFVIHGFSDASTLYKVGNFNCFELFMKAFLQPRQPNWICNKLRVYIHCHSILGVLLLR